MYQEFFMKILQILHGQLSGVHSLTLCLKIFSLSELFISYGKFPSRTSPVMQKVSKPNLFVPKFLLVTVTQNCTLNCRKRFDPKLQYYS